MLTESDAGKAEGGPGVWFCSSLSTHLPPHRHRGTEFNLVVSGRLTYRVEGRVLEVEAGNLLVLPAEHEHHLIEASPQAAFWVLEFREGRSPSWWEGEAAAKATSPGFRRTLLKHLQKLWCRPKAELLRSEAERTAGFLETPPQGTFGKTLELHPAVVRARALCETRPPHQLNVTSLAKQTGLSTSRLAHLFQEQLGLSPLQYLNFVKIQRFVGEYRPEQPNLMRNALLKGFGSYPQFHRTFLQVCGNPPGVHFRWLASDQRVSPSRSLPNVAHDTPH